MAHLARATMAAPLALLLLLALALLAPLAAAAPANDGAKTPESVTPAEEAAPVPTTPPTKEPASSTASKDLLIVADDIFINFFVDPFEDEDDIPSVFPPFVIYENNKVNPTWASGKVVIPDHLDMFKFDLWLGTQAAISPFLQQGITVTVTPRDKSVTTKLIVREGVTTRVEVEFQCDKDGSFPVDAVIKRGDAGKDIKLTVLKECLALHSNELIVSTRTGEVVYTDGKIQSPFNVHDLRQPSYIASKEDQTETLYFHTIHREYKFVGKPVVEAYDPTDEMLAIIARRSPSLYEVVKDFEAMSEEEKHDEAFYQENDDQVEEEEEDEVSEEGDADEEGELEAYDQGIDHTFTEKLMENGGRVAKPRKVPISLSAPKTSMLMESSKICQPQLSGEVYERTRKGALHITHRKDYGEKKLLGFAQAGLLGMHGGKRLALNYRCVNDGLAIIVLRVKVRAIEGDKEEDELRMSWLKVCSAEQIADGEIDLMGFDVRLGMFAREDASFFPILNGLTTEAFTWDGSSMRASPDEVSTSFYAMLSEAIEDQREVDKTNEFIRIRKVRITTRQRIKSPIVEPKLSGEGSYGGIISSDPLPITVHYNCRITGTVRFGLDIMVDVVTLDSDGTYKEVGDDVVHRLSFYWRKECAVTPLKMLFVSTANPDLFTTNSVPTAAAKKATHFSAIPVFLKGHIDPAFSSSSNAAVDRSKLFTVSSDQSTIAFELIKTDKVIRNEESPDHMGLRLRMPRLSSSSTSVQVSVRNIGEMTEMALLGKQDYEGSIQGESAAKLREKIHSGLYDDHEQIFEVTRNDPVYIVVDHVCTGPGSALITVELPVYTNEEKFVVIQWNKQCSWTEGSVSSKAAGGAVVLFVTIAILGTSSLFCVLLRRQKNTIRFLERRQRDGFDKMEVVSSI